MVSGTAPPAHTRYHPSGARSVPAGPPCTWCPLPASWPIVARFHDILLKVSQNTEVSPKSVQKACHSPYSQKRSKNSPLEILRFPLSGAFSHKELMGYFDHYLGLYCQNDEVSPMCTPWFRVAKGSQIPPRVPAASCFWGPAPHLLSAVFSTGPFLSVS